MVQRLSTSYRRNICRPGLDAILLGSATWSSNCFILRSYQWTSDMSGLTGRYCTNHGMMRSYKLLLLRCGSAFLERSRFVTGSNQSTRIQQLRPLATYGYSKKMASISVGEVIPAGSFWYVPYTPELPENELACAVPVPALLSTDAWKRKKVVLISILGAFTPTCDIDHLPPYLDNYDTLKAKGVDIIAVIAANDAFVMSGWARIEGLKDKIVALSDTNAEWSKKLGLSKDLTGAGLGIRTARYALILDDLVVKYIGAEPNNGVSVSGADAIKTALNNLYPSARM